MNIKKYLIGIIGVLFLTAISCSSDDSVQNPELSDQDLSVYFWGVGDNVNGIAWQGYDVLIGESVTVKLQVSPKDQTTVKWVDDATGEILSDNLEYTYSPTKEETKRVNFIATRPSGYEKTIVFNFRGTLGGYNSKINTWQSIKIPQGTQTGTFTAEFDMIPSKDIMDGVVTFLDGISTGYSSNSCIVRLNSSGKIDAYNDAGYAAENELTYHAGIKYHVRMEVDALNMTYSVYVTPQGENEVEIAKDYIFRRKVTHLDHWAMVAGDWQLDDPGTHRILNMEITTHTQNEAPVFTKVEDISIPEGSTLEVEIEATDPLGGNLKMEAVDLPRFATFVDHGYGKGTLTLKPYENCGGCDLGEFDIKITATNLKATTELGFKVEIFDPNAGIFITADVADNFANSPGPKRPEATVDGWINRPTMYVGGGVNWQDPEDTYDMAAIIPFAIPEIADGKKVTSAELKVWLEQVVSWAWQDYDLYGLPYRSDPTVLPSDYWQGAYGTDPNATAIQQRFAVKETSTGEHFSSEDAKQAFADYINAQIANGAKEGDFIFLRVNVNVADAPTYGRIDISSADAADATHAPELKLVLGDK